MIVLRSTYNKAIAQLNSAGAFYRSLRNENARLKEALQTIIAQETKAPNATVTRILTVAKAALGDGGSNG